MDQTHNTLNQASIASRSIDEEQYASALGELRAVLARFRSFNADSDIQADKRDVLAWFQPVFSTPNLPQLTADAFVPFLDFKKNKHWYGLQRLSGKLTRDMEALREGLAILLDENQPVGERLDRAVDHVYGLGKGVATPILMVSYPDKYGVWNSVSEAGLRALRIWPDFGHGVSLGAQYVVINDLLNHLAPDLDIDLWTLDALWHQLRLDSGEGPVELPDKQVEETSRYSPAAEMRFGLERHLHDFLWDNWNNTELGQDWVRYGQPGDDYPGYEFQTDVGRIDLLAHHRRDKRWLVIELKRGQTGDQTMGQVLRYMGWVQHHLAQPGDNVEGLIVAQQPDAALLYSLKVQANVALKLYEVEFRLKPASLSV